MGDYDVKMWTGSYSIEKMKTWLDELKNKKHMYCKEVVEFMMKVMNSERRKKNILKGAVHDDDNSIFHLICEEGGEGSWKKEMARVLESGRSTINQTNGRSSTPLLLAAYDGHTDIFIYLLNKGADIQPSLKNGMNELHL